VLDRTILKQEIEVNPILDGKRIMALRRILDKVVVADPIRDYAVRIVLASHQETEAAPESIKRFVRWGASPRASQALVRAGRVRALAEGRAHVSFDDIRHFALPVLLHRILLNYDGQAENANVAVLVQEILDNTPEEA